MQNFAAGLEKNYVFKEKVSRVLVFFRFLVFF